MLDSLSRTTSRWILFYKESVFYWWDNITFSQYMILMMLVLFCGWVLLKSCVNKKC